MTSNTSLRLKQIMRERGLKQVDILKLAQPYCEKFNIKLGKSDLSQFVSGKVEPGQWKLTILGLALDVSEAWLMGYDVPMARERPATTLDDGPDRLSKALANIGIDVDNLSESDIAKIAALAKLALDK